MPFSDGMKACLGQVRLARPLAGCRPGEVVVMGMVVVVGWVALEIVGRMGRGGAGAGEEEGCQMGCLLLF
jgi:hypothetical protein